METKIEKLPIKVIGKGEVKGYNFILIERNEKGCIYREESNLRHFEVFRHNVSPICIDCEKKAILQRKFQRILSKVNIVWQKCMVCV